MSRPTFARANRQFDPRQTVNRPSLIWLTRGRPTWVMVADASRARVFETGSVGQWHEAACWSHLESRQGERVGTTERPPRAFDSLGHNRHAIEVRTPPLVKERERFARELVDALAAGLARHAFEHLILMAPPRFLGELRELMDDALRRAVVGEVAHNLTRFEGHEIYEHLVDYGPT